MASGRQIDTSARRAVLAIAAGRATIGAGVLLRTRPALRLAGFPRLNPGGLALARLAGGRDLALAALTFAARRDRSALRAVMLASLAVDATDAVSLGIAGSKHRELRVAGIGGVLSGGGAALAGAWAWRRLAAEDNPGHR
jgi:hypothetical protein